MANFNVQKAFESGYTPEQVSQYLAQRKAQGVNLTIAQPQQAQQAPAPKKRGTLTSLLPLLGGIGGSVVGGIGGAPGIIGGGALGSGLGEFLAQKLSGEDTNPEKIVGETALGGVGGVAGLGVGRLLGAVGRGVGGELTQGAIRRGVKPGSNFATKVEQLTQAEKEFGLKGSPIAKGRKVTTLKDNLGKEREQLLTQEGGQSVDKTTFKKTLKDLVSNDSEYFDSANKSHNKSLQSLLGKIDKLPDEKLTPANIQKFRISLNSLATKAKAAIDKGDTSSLNANTIVARDTQQAIDKLLPDLLPKGSKERLLNINGRFGKAYGLEDIYAKDAQRGVSVPVIGNLGPAARPVQAMSDLTGRTLRDIPRAGVMAGATGQSIPRAFVPQDTEPMQGDMSNYAPSPSMDQGVPDQIDKTRDVFKMLMLQDLAQTGGKHIAELKTISDYMNPEGGADQRKAQAKASNAKNIINSFEQQLQDIGLSNSGPGARVQGVTRQVGAAIGTDQKAKVYNDLRKGFASNMIRAFGEVGTLTDVDINRALGLIPSLGDTQFEAARKLQEMRSLLDKQI